MEEGRLVEMQVEAGRAGEDTVRLAGRALDIEPLALDHARRLRRQGQRRTATLLATLEPLGRLFSAIRKRWSTETAALGTDESAVEWFLDNYFVIEQAVEQVRDGLPRGFYRELPVLDGVEPTPRVYELASDLLAAEGFHVAVDSLVSFLDRYQVHSPLALGEVWALPSLLRLVLLQEIGRATGALSGAFEREPELTAALAGRPSGAETPSPVSGAESGFEPADLVARAVAGLRVLEALDWEPTAERISVVHQTLTLDPAGVYPMMDYAGRDRYRREVEAVARRAPRSEAEVAILAVELASAAAHSRPAADDRDAAATTCPAAGEADADDARRGHVGFYLVDEGRADLEKQSGARPPAAERLRRLLSAHATGAYLSSIGAVSLLVVAAAAWYARPGGPGASLVAALLMLVPAVTAAVALTNWAVTKAMPARVLAKLDFTDGIPADHRCLVVVPALVATAADVDALLRQLQEHHARNPDPALAFAVLSDFADAPAASMPEDAGLLAHARQALDRLNQGTPGTPFLYLHRRRVWNASQQAWMGWERKRGKLHELNRLLLGEPDTSYDLIAGDRSRLVGVPSVITLDADTVLPPDAAQRLVGTLAHPLNRPVFDPDTGRVVAGYTVLQPRAEIEPDSAGRSRFTRIFAGDTTVDLYSRAVSDAYQDLFGAGIYVGKGIYDVAAFERSVAGRVPENSLLSHDLFEGVHGRVGLVTDITVYEEYPPNYLVGLLRTHRWVRGDWQLLRWLSPRTPRVGTTGSNDLPLIDRWKIVDNLRRSLLAPAVVALLLASWLGLPGSPPAWTALALLTPLAQVVAGLLATAGSLARGLVDPDRRDAWRPRLAALRTVTARWVMFVAALAIESALAADAILRTLWRTFVSHRNLLEWTTAAGATSLVGHDITVRSAARSTVPSLIATAVLGAGVAVLHPPGLAPAAPFLMLWLAAPWFVVWVSRPIAPPRRARLTAAQRRTFGALARRTWLFFEQHVGPEDNWLPPDNVQEQPLGVVAHRTSPTNIGLYLVSCLAAHDRGYLGTPALVSRLSMALDALDKVERYRGHLPNWLDTTSLQPLRPAYVSTVDSGNLAACLVVLAQGCEQALEREALAKAPWRGLVDAVALVGEGVGTGKAAEALRGYLAELAARFVAVAEGGSDPDPAALLAGIHHRLPAMLADLAEGPAHIELDTLTTLRLHSSLVGRGLQALQRDTEGYTPWVPALLRPPGLAGTSAPGAFTTTWRSLLAAVAAEPTWQELPEHCDVVTGLLTDLLETLPESNTEPAAVEARAWAAGLLDAVAAAGARARELRDGLSHLAARARGLVDGLDLAFLYNHARGVFHIGYNLESGTLDGSYYDLLASEARITSLVAIARHQVPQKHWLHLGRPMTRTLAGERALLSWSGTMFEYLLPTLLVETPPSSLLGRTCAAVVTHQIAYGRSRGVPWGISESGFYAFDAHRLYQYRAFGVPGLGLQRRTGDDLVIAPYASLMATPFDPEAVATNLARLADLGAIGRLGAYEAVDYTRSRVPMGREVAIVRSHMAHHQGMILLALAQALDGPRMIQRFHAEPFTASVSLLLREEPPQIPEEPLAAASDEAPSPAPSPLPSGPWVASHDPHEPGVHVISNGTYGVLLTDSGSGASTLGQVALTRWRADASLEEWGSWLYLQDLDSGERWSAARRPLGEGSAEPAVFHPARAEFRAWHHGIRTDLNVTVAPDDNVEIRRLDLANESDHPRRLAVTSFAEVVLTDAATDLRHPAFGKLFIEAEELPGDLTGLLFRRRPRSAEETPTAVAFGLVRGPAEAADGDPATWGVVRRSADRAGFLGRLRTASEPAGLDPDGWWTRPNPEVQRAPLDPAAAIGQAVDLPPHSRVRLALVTCAGEAADALDLVRRYQSWAHIEHTVALAASRADHELRDLGFHGDDLSHTQRLLSLLTFPDPGLVATPALPTPAAALPALWGLGISGDLPLVGAHLAGDDDLPLVEDLLRAHRYWRRRGVHVDLALIDEQSSGYAEGLRRPLQRLVRRWGAELSLNVRGGVFIVSRDQIGDSGLAALHHAAQVVFPAGQGGLGARLARRRERPAPLPAFDPGPPPDQVEPASTPAVPATDLVFDNGVGGFTPDGREYHIRTGPGRLTPAPWANVIATPTAGFLCSESGLGATWAGNSGENRLTPWRNDPVTDLPAEAVYVRDEETGQVWTPTPQPAGAAVDYLTRHGAGYTQYEHTAHGLAQRLRAFAVWDAPAKAVSLQVRNLSGRPRRLTVTYYAEWVLGVHRDGAGHRVRSSYDQAGETLLAENPFHPDRAGAVAFLAGDRPVHGWTADRLEFLGRPGSLARPAGLTRIGLARTSGPGHDPCAALQVHLDLPAGGVEDVTFLLGQAAGRQEALETVERLRGVGVDAAWDANRAHWDDLLGAVQVRTPDPALDLMVNRWLPYQTLAGRMWGRTGYHQSSGAYGFRDQLQDSLALLWSRPDLTREHLLRAAGHQFTAGDVLHWWHEPARGVRTRISDDLLWLPYATARYLEATGDASVLAEPVPFLAGDPLAAGEHERYDTWPVSAEAGDLLEHCRRAVERGVTAGAHGLPLIGTGDWNDGMNRVGAAGRGESVWLAWFAHAALLDLAALCERSGAGPDARRYRERAALLPVAVDRHAWDGSWYLRAFDDDGAPLGSAENAECRIDSIAQSWAVLSGAPRTARTAPAVRAAVDQLVAWDDRLILLFTPPFDRTAGDPGYIKGYLPGVRENGGQYTHAATWLAWATADLGDGGTAAALLDLINPIRRTGSADALQHYQAEPYVLAADVYAGEHAGRGGWTWYTGSSAWFYRCAVEGLLGLTWRGDQLLVDPHLPPDWPSFTATLRRAGTTVRVTVRRTPDGRLDLHQERRPGPGEG